MGRLRARASEALGARVVQICDCDLAVARGLAAELASRPVVVSNTSALDWQRVDAVFVCTPPGVRDAALQAAAHGVAFLVEKPLGLSLRACKPLLDLLRDRPVLGAVGYMNRYRASIERAKQRLAGEELIAVSCNWIGKPYGVPWWGVADQSGGPLNEQATHLVDLIRHLTSQEIIEVSGLAASGSESGQTYAVVMRLARGQVATLLYSCAALGKSIDIDLFRRTGPLALTGWDFQLVQQGKPADAPEDKQAIFTREVAQFFRAVASGQTSAVRSSVADAARTQAVVDAMRRTLETQRSVLVDEVG